MSHVTLFRFFTCILTSHASLNLKWHLDGELKGRTQFGAVEGRSFGFDDMKYQWNRGHWKCLSENENGELTGYSFKECEERFENNMTQHYATDFLTDRAINFMTEKKRNNETFALFLSLPDPHSPHTVRAPYDTMFNDMTFSVPQTARAALTKNPAIPPWAYIDQKIYGNSVLSDSSQIIAEVESSRKFQRSQREIFGMVKLIDDSVGRILETLETHDLDENTIVVFTSDHGDLMHERKI